MVLELVLTAVRAWTEEQRLFNHIKKINLALNNPNLMPEHIDELNHAKIHAQEMLSHTHKKYSLSLGISVLTTSLFVIKNIMLPLFLVSAAANPIIPFLFAAIALSITVANHYLTQLLNENKPKVNVGKGLEKHGFFSSQNTQYVGSESVPVHSNELALRVY